SGKGRLHALAAQRDAALLAAGDDQAPQREDEAPQRRLRAEQLVGEETHDDCEGARLLVVVLVVEFLFLDLCRLAAAPPHGLLFLRAEARGEDEGEQRK